MNRKRTGDDPPHGNGDNIFPFHLGRTSQKYGRDYGALGEKQDRRSSEENLQIVISEIKGLREDLESTRGLVQVLGGLAAIAFMVMVIYVATSFLVHVFN